MKLVKKSVKKLICAILTVALCLSLLPATSKADETDGFYGDFYVTDAQGSAVTSNVTYSEGVLTIQETGYKVQMKTGVTSTTDRIVFNKAGSSGGHSWITLDKVSISTTSGPAIQITRGFSDVTITGTSTLRGTQGIHFQQQGGNFSIGDGTGTENVTLEGVSGSALVADSSLGFASSAISTLFIGAEGYPAINVYNPAYLYTTYNNMKAGSSLDSLSTVTSFGTVNKSPQYRYLQMKAASTVTYNANGGTGTMGSASIDKGSDLTLPSSTFTPPSGKVFDQWTLGSTSGTAYEAGSTYTVTGDVTFYAKWKNISYDVSITNPMGSHMTKTSGEASQTGLTGAMVSVVYTADSGYYFPESYNSNSSLNSNGITVTRINSTQIEVAGTPTANTAITLLAATKQPYDVSITNPTGSYMTKTSGEASQTGLTGAMVSVVYTADSGYYFPESYNSNSSLNSNGITVTRINSTQIEVAGTPTANTAITLLAATQQTVPVFTDSGQNTAVKSAGTVEMKQEQIDGAPPATINNSSAQLSASVLTVEEQNMVAQGENVRVIFKVTDISASVSETEKQLIHQTLASSNTDGNAMVLYVDMSLFKQIGNQEQTRITETSGKISVSIEVPELLWNSDATETRSFYIIRVHDNEASRIEGTYDGATHRFTFETDRFSTYALVYQNTNQSLDTSQIQSTNDFYHLQLKVTEDQTSQTLTYKKIANATGYLIYGGKCGETMTKLKTVSADTTSYTVKNLKQETYYKYQVKAYQIIDGKKVILSTSRVVHAITWSKLKGNPIKVTADTSSVILSTGKSKVVTCKLVMPQGKKHQAHTANIRYESSDKGIATVNQNGNILAKAKGTCYVYAYAQNGVYKKIKVTVEE